MISLIRHSLFLARRHLLSAPGLAVVLILGTTVALFLPLFTYLAAERIEDRLLQRADSSPLLLGRKGNEFDLTMASLYFRGAVKDPIPASRRDEIEARGYGLAVPLYVNHSSSGVPIVGTSIEYFDARGLRIAAGRRPGLLGELVAGAEIARNFKLEVGDRVRSDLTNLYNIAGAYPKLLEVVGILEPSGSPDDEVFFADVKTVWLLDGSLHGHQEVTPETALNPDAEEGTNLEATAALFMLTEITEANRTQFHFHGGQKDLPLSAVLVFPRNQKAHDQILGDYILEETLQAVEPVEVIRTILGIVLRVNEGLAVYFGLVAVSTAAFFFLVLTLTLRLRRDEITLMRRVGCSRFAIPTIVGAEVVLIVLLSIALAVLLSWLGIAVVEVRLG